MMNASLDRKARTSSRPDRLPHAAHGVFGDTPDISGMRSLDRICRTSGGIARADDLARLIENCRGEDLVTLSRLLSQRAVFAFGWHGVLRVPMFQFDLLDLSVRVGPRRVLAALGEVFDGWTLAVWFARPNGWLQGQRPMDLSDTNTERVIHAARADRFIAEIAPPFLTPAWSHS